MSKKYEDMTPEEQFEFRTTDNGGIMFNGRMYTEAEMRGETADEPAPEEPETPDPEPAEDTNEVSALDTILAKLDAINGNNE